MAIEPILDIESAERYPLIPILIGIQITFYLTEQVLTYLQMTSANIKERPAEIKALGFTSKEFIVSQVYSFDKLVFDSMTAGFSTAVWLILYLSSAYPFLWEKIPVFFPFIDATSEVSSSLPNPLTHSSSTVLSRFDVPVGDLCVRLNPGHSLQCVQDIQAGGALRIQQDNREDIHPGYLQIQLGLHPPHRFPPLLLPQGCRDRRQILLHLWPYLLSVGDLADDVAVPERDRTALQQI